MKQHVFKSLPKGLEPSITLELLNAIQKLPTTFPAIIDGNTLDLLRANDKAYWIREGNGYRKNGNGYVTIPTVDALIGKARYYLANRETLIEEAIQAEVASIKESLRIEAKKLIDDFDFKYMQAYEKYRFKPNMEPNELMKAVLESQYKANPELAENNARIQAIRQKVFTDNPAYEAAIVEVHRLLEEEDFDTLYIALRTNGLPQLARFDKSNPSDMEALKAVFHSNVLDTTIESLVTHSHLYNVARCNVLPKFP